MKLIYEKKNPGEPTEHWEVRLWNGEWNLAVFVFDSMKEVMAFSRGFETCKIAAKRAIQGLPTLEMKKK